MNKIILLLSLLICWNASSQLAIISANDSTLCQGQVLVLSSNFSIAGDSPIIFSVFTISKGGIIISDTVNFGTELQITLPEAGLYDVSLTNIHEDLTESSIVQIQFVEVFANPHAQFIANELGNSAIDSGESAYCPPVIYNFQDATPTSNEINNWTWIYDYKSDTNEDYQRIIFSHEQNPDSVLSKFAGTYDLIFVVQDSNFCTDSIHIDAFLVIDGPRVSYDLIENPESCGQNHSIHLLDFNIVSNYIWSLSDGAQYEKQNNNDSILTHQFNEVGEFISIFTVEDNTGCEVEYVDTIYIEDNGVEANFISSQLYATNSDSILFTDVSVSSTGEILKRIWDFGNGTNDTLSFETSISHLYPFPGDYICTLTVINENHCRNRHFEQIDIINSSENHCYPNPATNTLHFYHENYLEINNLFILDNFGSQIMILQPLSNPQIIDISGLTNGIYVLKFWLENQWNCEEFVVLN